MGIDYTPYVNQPATSPDWHYYGIPKERGKQEGQNRPGKVKLAVQQKRPKCDGPNMDESPKNAYD